MKRDYFTFDNLKRGQKVFAVSRWDPNTGLWGETPALIVATIISVRPASRCVVLSTGRRLRVHEMNSWWHLTKRSALTAHLNAAACTLVDAQRQSRLALKKYSAARRLASRSKAKP